MPFVYSITFTNPKTKNKRYYIGSRYARNCHPSDLFTIYFTSSLAFQKLLNEFGKSSFKTKIVKTFEGTKDARDYELLLIKRAVRFGMKLKRELINGSYPNSMWPITIGISPPNKGKKYEEYLSHGQIEKIKAGLRKPKTKKMIQKMVSCRRLNGSYNGGNKHPRAKKFILTDPSGNEIILNGNLKNECKRLNLSWQTLFNNKNNGKIVLDS